MLSVECECEGECEGEGVGEGEGERDCVNTYSYSRIVGVSVIVWVRD